MTTSQQNGEGRTKLSRLTTDLTRIKKSSSYSRLKRFEECAYAWWLKYVEGLSDNSYREAGELGSALHEYFAARIRGVTAEPAPPLSKHRDWGYMKRQIDQIVGYIDQRDVVAVEEWFTADVDVDGFTVTERARVDLLLIDDEGVASIPDLKSGWRLPKRIEDWDQGPRYAWIVKQRYPHITGVRTWPIRLRPGPVLPALEMTTEDIDRYGELLKRRLRAYVQERDYKPQPGEHCRHCAFLLRCPAGTDWLGPQLELAGQKLGFQLQNEEDRAEAVRALIWLRAANDRVTSLLRRSTSEHGPIRLPDGTVAGFRRREKQWRWRKEEIEEPEYYLQFEVFRPTDDGQLLEGPMPDLEVPER